MEMMENTGALRAEVLDTRRRTRRIHLTVPAGDPGVRRKNMQKEYGCNELMMDGGYCTSIGDVVCLCDECQRKIIEKIELLEGAKNTEQQLEPNKEDTSETES